MAKNSILIGLLLILVGAVGYFDTGTHSLTALIPAGFGILILLCGLVVLVNESLRKHIMHAAALVALIGAIACMVRAIPQMSAFVHGTARTPAAVSSQIVTTLLCIIFLILCIQSFVAARRNR